MKKLTPSLVRIASITGLALGAFTISALAADWTAAPCTAPSCNVSAPLNVGPSEQSKEGGLAVGKTTGVTSNYKFDVNGLGLFQGLLVNGKVITNTLQVTSGDKTVGNVLASDGIGNANWASISSLLTSGSALPGSVVGGGFELLDKLYLGTLSAYSCKVIFGNSVTCVRTPGRPATDIQIVCPTGSTKRMVSIAQVPNDLAGDVWGISIAASGQVVIAGQICVQN